MDRRVGPDQPIMISPTHDFEPSAPSPDSIAASPMISARMSDCAEMPLESDDGDAASYTSRRSTFSSRMDFNDFIRDSDFQKKSPELFKFINDHRDKIKIEKFEGPPGINIDRQAGMANEIYDMFMEMRDLKRKLYMERRSNERLSEDNKKYKDLWAKAYSQAEQEEEYISNTLLKRIQQLKNEKDHLTQRYETELASANSELQTTISCLHAERDQFDTKLKKEHTAFVDSLYRRIRCMENDIDGFRQNIDRLRVEKVDQENALEHEQELLFNTLGKQLDLLNAEKRALQVSLEKAFQNGFVDPDFDMAALNQAPPLLFKEQLHNCNGEVMRFRSQLKHAERQIADLKERLISKDEKIKILEETNKHLLWYKERFTRMRNMMQADIPPEEGSQVSMGPPSVPPTPRSVDNSSDMDESVSWPHSVD